MVPPHFVMDNIYAHGVHTQVAYPDRLGFEQGLTPAMVIYNSNLKNLRSVVENLFGLVKQRWRCLP